MKQYAYFNELPVGTEFGRNGNLWRKVSTRTARILTPVEYSHHWFYFGRLDLCVVGLHSRLAA